MAPSPRALPALLRALCADLADLVAPRTCAACRRPLAAPSPLCASCEDSLAPAESLPPGVAAPYAFGGALATAVHRAKYAPEPGVARALGALLVPAAHTLPERPDLVVAVPLHPRRLARRGFNQSAELARAVTAALRAPQAFGLVARVRDTPSQTSLHRAEREENVRGAFRVRAPARVEGRAVLVVDDVVTTGATLAAVRAALTNAGARSVHALALARAPLG